MADEVVVELSLGVVVTDVEALVAAAIERFEASGAAGTPEAAVSFKEHLRSNLGSAVHQLIDPRRLVVDIPGVEFEGQASTARLQQPGEPLPWHRPAD